MKKWQFALALVFVLASAQTVQAQLVETKLQVIVSNDMGNLVEGAIVTLYKTEKDYDNEENPVQSAVTDAKGRVLFYELEAISYYMNVVKDDMTNIGRGAQTSKLIAKKKNLVGVVIE